MRNPLADARAVRPYDRYFRMQMYEKNLNYTSSAFNYFLWKFFGENSYRILGKVILQRDSEEQDYFENSSEKIAIEF